MLNKEQGVEKYIVNHSAFKLKKNVKKATIKQSGRVPS
jgi:hypothetical protein